MAKSKRRKPKHTGPTQPKKKPPAGGQQVRMTSAGVAANSADVEPNTVMMAFIHPGDVRGEFATSMFVTALSVPEVQGLAVRQSGPRVAASRNVLVKEFLMTRFEWLLMVDADMFWTPEDVRYVIEASDRDLRPFIGGLCFADQVGNLFPTIYLFGEDGEQFHIALEYPENKVVPVDGTGAAFSLVHRSVYERVAAAKYEVPNPWYADEIVRGMDRGEDLTFCARVRKLDIPIHVDTRAKIGHVKNRYLTEEEYHKQKVEGRFLVTGTGRCGTGFISRLLSLLHQPTGHETVFNPDTIAEAKGAAPAWAYNRGEASWMAAPYLDGFTGPTLHLVRNPLDVVRSLVGIGFLDGKPAHSHYSAFVEQTLGVVYPATDDRDELIRRSVEFIIKWTALIDRPDMPYVRVEDMQDPEYARQAVGLLIGTAPDKSKMRDVLAGMGTNINHRRRDDDITWDDVPELIAVAERYGYETP